VRQARGICYHRRQIKLFMMVDSSRQKFKMAAYET